MRFPWSRRRNPAKRHAEAVQAVRDARARKAKRDEGEAIRDAYMALHERLRAGA